jgi:hypothetical protein
MSARRSTFGSSPRRADILRVQIPLDPVRVEAQCTCAGCVPKTVSGHPDCGSRALSPFRERAVFAAFTVPYGTARYCTASSSMTHLGGWKEDGTVGRMWGYAFLPDNIAQSSVSLRLQ